MWIKVTDGVPAQITRRAMREQYPNTSFPKDPSSSLLQSFDIHQVDEVDQPDVDPSVEKVDGYTFVEVDGTWEQQWNIVPLTTQQQQQYQDELDLADDIDQLKQDNQVAALLRARPDQINSYIESNVTNIASAKTVLKILARALAVLSQSTLKD